MRLLTAQFPVQKLPTSKKTKKWYKECVDGAEALAIYRTAGEVEYHRKMQVWEDLDNDIINENEIEEVFNPLGLREATFPAAIKNYPLSVPKIDLLQGEEIKRKFDWKVLSRNEEAFNSKTEELKNQIMEIMMAEIQNEAFNEEDAQKKIEKTAKYHRYDYKDLNEVWATQILEYLWREQDLKSKFSRGFREGTVKGREIYRIDDVGGEPSMIKCDPKNVYILRKGDSHKIEDSDIILEITYEPIARVIDEFYDYLDSKEVSAIEEGFDKQNSGDGGILGYQAAPVPLWSDGSAFGTSYDGDADPLMAVNTFNLPYDQDGNVRVVRARWVGRRKIGRLTYYDPVTGNEEERFVSENYTIKKEEGETVKWLWINEAYEGTRIADSIYVKMQPRQVQMRHFDNPSKCFLGYVGTDYGKSLMSRMEPYQYLYNVYMRRLELAIAKYKGPIYELDLSKKPDEWEEDMWMYYAEVLGWAVVDPFNEGKKGAATGTLAGNFNTTGKVLNADPGNYIRYLIEMLQYIHQQMGEIAGITAQREGQVDNRETVGGVERAVAQSSHITEKWFFVHDETKKRAMLALLDTAKAMWKNKKSKKIQYVLDDMSTVAIDVNGKDFAASELDIFVSDSSDDLKIRQTIEQLSHAYVQGGGSLTLPIKVLRSDSITQMAKLIEEEEERMTQRNEQLEEKKLKSQEAIAAQQDEREEAKIELENRKIDADIYKVDEDNKTKLIIAGLQPEEDDSLDKEKLELQRDKHQSDEAIKKQGVDLKKEQLAETKRHNLAAERKQRQQAKVK